MLKRSAVPVYTIVVMALFLLSFSSLAANSRRNTPAPRATAPKPNCSKTSNADIVKAIREQLKADPDIAPEMSHVNVSVRKRTVKLEGWLSDKTLISKAVAIARRSPCVKKVINKLKMQGGSSCGPGQKPCNGICIDISSSCNTRD